MRSPNEIRKKLAETADFYDNDMQSKWPGMSYEEGVEAALRWVLEEGADDPLEE